MCQDGDRSWLRGSYVRGPLQTDDDGRCRHATNQSVEWVSDVGDRSANKTVLYTHINGGMLFALVTCLKQQTANKTLCSYKLPLHCLNVSVWLSNHLFE